MKLSGYDSSSIGTLFAGFGNDNSSNNAGLLGINFTDYANIRSGSYFKLLKAYYSEDDASSKAAKAAKASSKQQAKSTTATSKDDQKTLSGVEKAADSLVDGAQALYKSSSLFQKSTATDENGKTVSSYDTDKIYGAVKSFVDGYNNMLKEAGKSNVGSISRSVSSVVSTTKSNETLLKSLGITIDKDNNSLSINADTFKKADMSNAKSLFSGNGSYAYSVAAKAAMIHSYAESEAAKANTYTGSGKYGNNFSSGSIFDTMF